MKSKVLATNVKGIVAIKCPRCGNKKIHYFEVICRMKDKQAKVKARCLFCGGEKEILND